MKKFTTTSFIILGLTIALIGCNATTEEDSLSKTGQKIEVVSNGETENIITSVQEIEDFVESLHMEAWELGQLPDHATESKRYELYKLDTITLVAVTPNDESSMNGVIISYEDIPYIRLSTESLSFDFKVPEEVADQLR
ncbi:hypothetical protein [Bacillus sp. JCM 19034]|uniref:hypothetical protein n=1 Tax=Bacillus sp. JCM 19034 TaxID=1481928 RepID=UPI00078230D9|nr:hypothetical protein [Bacillus sp. JCM 19034]